jgi:hypothetical protein
VRLGASRTVNGCTNSEDSSRDMQTFGTQLHGAADWPSYALKSQSDAGQQLVDGSTFRQRGQSKPGNQGGTGTLLRRNVHNVHEVHLRGVLRSRSKGPRCWTCCTATYSSKACPTRMRAVFSAVVGEQVCDLHTQVLVEQQHATGQHSDRRRQCVRAESRPISRRRRAVSCPQQLPEHQAEKSF